MSDYIEISVTRTSKVAGKNTNWQRFDQFRKSFPDMADMNKWLKNNYGSCTRTKMYRDTPFDMVTDFRGGGSEQVGWIYKWREKGSVQGDYGTYYMQDWVEIHAIRASNPLASKGRKK